MEIDNEKPIYTYNEVYDSTLNYFNGDTLATQVWINKYCLKDSEGNYYEKNPEDMHHRLAKEISRIENKYNNANSEDNIFNALDHFKYIVPAGGSMTGIGNDFQVSSLSNCFVIGSSTGNSDSYGGIIHSDEELIQLMKRRGGVGHDVSYIRPNGSPVKNAALTSTGVVPFMERFSNSTREVAQDGRRGALMLSISIDHPDSEAFIDAKMKEGKITGANVSVKITDKFMQAVENNDTYLQRYPISGDDIKFIKSKNARELWNKIVHNAWRSAEPGVLFWDTIINESIPDCYGDEWKTIGTNPCGEVPLCDGDSCRLLALNLYSFVDNPFTLEAKFNYALFDNMCKLAMRMMDNIIDLELEKIQRILDKINTDPEPDNIKRTEYELWQRIYNKCKLGRRTGIGVTAEADMLAALGITYGTKKATDFCVNIHKMMAISVYQSSITLAKERGKFSIYNSDKEKENPFVNRLFSNDEFIKSEMHKNGRRNIACLSIAPTGSLSIMTQTSSGLEPVFKVVYKRRRKINPNDKNARVDYIDQNGDSFEEYIVYHPKFKEWMKINNYDLNKKYSEEEINNLIEKSPYYKASANDIDAIEKVHMQGAIQKWCDHSISITHNLPADVSEEVIADLYFEAWKSGCKGITVYRDGSRSGVLVSQNSKKKEEVENKIIENRPKKLDCDVIRFTNKGEKWVAFVGLLNNEPYEIFTGVLDEDEGIFLPKNVDTGEIIKVVDENGFKHYDFHYCNKNGYKMIIEAIGHKFNKEYWNYARLISGILRYKMPIDNVIKLIDSLDVDSDQINTWKNGVKRALKKYIKDGTKATGKKCPHCNEETLVYQEGCLVCTNCGYSKCGG